VSNDITIRTDFTETVVAEKVPTERGEGEGGGRGGGGGGGGKKSVQMVGEGGRKGGGNVGENKW